MRFQPARGANKQITPPLLVGPPVFIPRNPSMSRPRGTYRPTVTCEPTVSSTSRPRIRCNTVEPGTSDTPEVTKEIPEETEELIDDSTVYYSHPSSPLTPVEENILSTSININPKTTPISLTLKQIRITMPPTVNPGSAAPAGQGNPAAGNAPNNLNAAPNVNLATDVYALPPLMVAVCQELEAAKELLPKKYDRSPIFDLSKPEQVMSWLKALDEVFKQGPITLDEGKICKALEWCSFETRVTLKVMNSVCKPNWQGFKKELMKLLSESI
jgi:hypothetical protein